MAVDHRRPAGRESGYRARPPRLWHRMDRTRKHGMAGAAAV